MERQLHPQTQAIRSATGLQNLAGQEAPGQIADATSQRRPSPIGVEYDGARAVIAVWFPETHLNEMCIGQVSQIDLLLKDQQRRPLMGEGGPDTAFEVEIRDGRISIWSTALQLTEPYFVAPFVNGVGLSNLALSQDGYARHGVVNKDERLAIFQNQPAKPDEAVQQEAAFFPATPYLPNLQVPDDSPTYPKCQAQDGREIEDPRTYAYRDDMPAGLGLQTEWRRVHATETERWYRGAARGKCDGVIVACLLSRHQNDAEAMLKVQVYAGADWQPVRRINGVKVDFEYGVEEKEHGLNAPNREGQWWTAVVADSADIDRLLIFEHEDEIDRFTRQVLNKTEGPNAISAREAYRLALRDHAEYVASIR